ncbi:MAG: hypothetical protein ACLQHT_18215 [Terracidiphilus sp.]
MPKQATNEKPIPHIPLPFEEVMKDVLKVKPPAKAAHKQRKKRKATPVASSNS